MQDFVHLHVHTQYSVLDGQAAVPKLVDKAIGDGMRGMAITDHGNMMGIKEFFNYTQKVCGKAKGKVKEAEDVSSLNVADLAAGVYVVKATTEAGIKTARIVKK